ncbi:MAG: aromatic ring-hydroxylating dioxygenase subunit alpha [Rhodospirillaceae bacterium]|nr:aromatic ring-hydroxylating dioxygenase subunit alpha [Rhodospirillaceae bacterium]
MSHLNLAHDALQRIDRDPARSYTLPGFYYYDPDIFEREKRAIFYRTWQYVGHVSMLATPGRYIVREIVDQSVIVLRDREGALRSYFNVCQHRAHRLLEGEGQLPAASITCPYHTWTYDLGGNLRKARATDRVAGFDPAAFGLKPLRLESFLGFLFVNLDGAAAPFETVSGPLAAEIASFSPHAASLKCAHRDEYPLKANWKNSVENYSECYHCPNQHQTLVNGALDIDSYRVVTFEHHHSHSSRDKGASTGYSTRTEGSNRPGEFASWLLWPNWSIESYPGGNLTVFHHVPLGPEESVQRCEWYFPYETPSAADREVIDFVHEVRREDIPICESVQKGLHSLGYRQGRFVVDADRSDISEHAVHDFQMKVLTALGEKG